MSLPGSRRGHAFFLLALASAVAWLFRDVLFLGGVYFKRDIHLVWHPQVEGFVRAVAAGSLPVWDPSLAFGQPLLADPSAQILYPLTWLNLVLRPATYYSLYAILHFVLAALGMRRLALRLGLSQASAAVAAAVYCLSGPYLSLVDLWHHFAGASLLPWVVLALDRAVRGGRRDVGLFALALGAQILAGSTDLVAMTLLVGFALAAARMREPSWPRWPEARGALGRAIVGTLLGVGLSAALWATALEIVGRAARANLPATVRTYWSLHPLVALETVLPGLFSALPLSRPVRAAFFESREPFLSSLYLGVCVLGLVGAAVLASRHRLRGLLLGVLVLAGLVSMGPHTPIYGAVVTLVPPLQILRYPVKAMAVAAFAWSLLAGLGAGAWWEGSHPRRLRLGTCLAVAPVLGLALLAALAASTQGDALTARMLTVPEGLEASSFLRGATIRSLITAALAAATLALAGGREPARWRVNALVALAVIDLFLLHRSANPVAPPLLYAHRPEVLTALGPSPAGVRVYVYDYSVPGTIERHLGGRAPYAPARMPEGFTLDAAGALAMQMYMAPEAGGRFALSQAFNVDYRGLHSASLDRFTSLLRSVEGTPFHLRLLRLAGVEHAVSLHPMDDLAPEREVQGLFSRPILLHRVPDPLPRTYVVGAARRRPDDKDAARLLLDPGFNPSAEVVVASGAELSAAPGFESRARLLEARPDRVVLEAETSAPGVVVLLEGFDPGWRVRLDGQPAELLRANLAFRAVAVPAGRHRIEMTYRPWGLLAGLAAAGLSLVFIGALVRSGSSR